MTLVFLMAVCQKKGIFVPIYERAKEWEKNRIKNTLFPHWQLSAKGELVQLYKIDATLPLSPGVIFSNFWPVRPFSLCLSIGTVLLWTMPSERN